MSEIVIHIPEPQPGFDVVIPDRNSDMDPVWRELPVAKGWRPLHVTLLGRGDDGTALRASDSPYYGESLCFLSVRAADCLRPLLSKHAEFLPVDCDSKELVLLHSLRIIDALDHGASVEVAGASGELRMVSKFVFHRDRIDGVPLFRIANWIGSPYLVTSEVVECWTRNGLEGVTFREVWRG